MRIKDLINIPALEQLPLEDVASSIIVMDYQNYKDFGGTKDELDIYFAIKTNAKRNESKYIQLMDMLNSGIEVNKGNIIKYQKAAQVLYHIIKLWWNKPLRKVDYNTFNLEEFNKW